MKERVEMLLQKSMHDVQEVQSLEVNFIEKCGGNSTYSTNSKINLNKRPLILVVLTNSEQNVTSFYQPLRNR